MIAVQRQTVQRRLKAIPKKMHYLATFFVFFNSTKHHGLLKSSRIFNNMVFPPKARE
jgi:hypothetical protein